MFAATNAGAGLDLGAATAFTAGVTAATALVANDLAGGVGTLFAIDVVIDFCCAGVGTRICLTGDCIGAAPGPATGLPIVLEAVRDKTLERPFMLMACFCSWLSGCVNTYRQWTARRSVRLLNMFSPVLVCPAARDALLRTRKAGIVIVDPGLCCRAMNPHGWDCCESVYVRSCVL